VVLPLETLQQLECRLAEPSPACVDDIGKLSGDILILGVGGKMGPSLARMARNAVREAGVNKRIIGVSRFSTGGLAEELEAEGIATVAADLMDDEQLQALPDAENVIYMVGFKFGSTGQEHLAWAVNTFLPGRVAQRFGHSRIAAFSTGNVYPLTPWRAGGATEEHPTGPVGEYAQSCLGRERILQFFSRQQQTPMVLLRLNYAIDLRYGVLLDVATAVRDRRPIDVSMGYANVIWQGDANEMALRSLRLAASPPRVLNITGPETTSIRWLGERFGELLGVKPVFAGVEQDTALLSRASLAHRLFGQPRVSLQQMIEWTARWVEVGGHTLDKPTHFQEREGRF
jgi:nucleoside-diphosphate-sugar epimerase